MAAAREERIPRDGCLVPAEPFAEVVRDFIAGWNRDRPQPGGQYGLTEEPPVRALAWLSAEATRVSGGVVVRGIRVDLVVTEGTLEGLIDRGPRAKQTLEWRIADAIATALNSTVMYDERVVVVPNAAATRKAQAACCSGSVPVAA